MVGKATPSQGVPSGSLDELGSREDANKMQ